MLSALQTIDYSPSTYVNSSLDFFVTSVWRHILSSGKSCFRAVTCIMAVKKDCGLKKPPNQTAGGR